MIPLAAIILAAGLSRRMGNHFKPLMPFGNDTVLEHVIRTYLKAGIHDIIVVCGYRADTIKSMGGTWPVTIIENQNFQDGMLSSVKAGIRSLDEKYNGFFIHPVDIPLVRQTTIQKLAAVFQHSDCEILHPVFMDQQGHPPLISRRIKYDILNWDGKDGLRGAISDIRPRPKDILVCDQGILCDMDTPEEYDQMIPRLEELDIPTLGECQMAMDRIYNVADDIKKHCQTVALAALLFLNELEKKGYRLNKHRVITSALLHDIVRGRKHHAKVGAQVLKEMGFDGIADIVADHMAYDVDDVRAIDEKALVYLSDKLIQEDQPVNLIERFQRKADACSNFPEIATAIKQKLYRATTVKKKLEAMLGVTVEEVFKQHHHLFQEDIFDDLFNAAW